MAIVEAKVNSRNLLYSYCFFQGLYTNDDLLPIFLSKRDLGFVYAHRRVLYCPSSSTDGKGMHKNLIRNRDNSPTLSLFAISETQ